jgi:nitroimidazol reductase NimA-like FMN-containing flavoprotein (pyridoxamine 5'-phosphate oxidase superfamily)
MSEHERQEFLAGVHVGVISIERVDGPPLTVPIWYGYEPGGSCGSSPAPNPSREGC